jgi:hypothetical protein
LRSKAITGKSYASFSVRRVGSSRADTPGHPPARYKKQDTRCKIQDPQPAEIEPRSSLRTQRNPQRASPGSDISLCRLRDLCDFCGSGLSGARPFVVGGWWLTPRAQ